MKKTFDAFSIRGALAIVIGGAGLVYNLLVLPQPLTLSLLLSGVFLVIGGWLLFFAEAID